MDQSLKFGFIPIEGGSYYPQFLEEVLLGEKLGFDSVWLEGHHGIRDHYWPSPLVGTDIIVRVVRSPWYTWVSSALNIGG
jgi:hypothetical protein